MKNYVSALDLIELSNDIGNAILFCEHAINQLELGKREHDYEILWRDHFEIYFWDHDDALSDAAKVVIEELIKSLCLAQRLSLLNEEELFNHDSQTCEQYELDF